VDVLVENVLDPSHVPFSHHGVIGGADRTKPSLYRRAPGAAQQGSARQH